MKNFIHKVKKPALLVFYGYFIISMVLVPYALAQNGLVNPLEAKTFLQLLADILVLVRKIGIIAAVVAIIWAGYLFVSAGGNEESIKKAKTIFFWTIIGAAIIIGAEVIVKAVDNFFKDIRY